MAFVNTLEKAIKETTEKGGEVGGILCHPSDSDKFKLAGVPYIASAYVVEGNAFLVNKETFDSWRSGRAVTTFL